MGGGDIGLQSFKTRPVKKHESQSNMLKRVAPLSRSLLRVQAAGPSRRFGHGFKPVTEVVAEHKSGISAIQVPAGSWSEHHAKRNAKWNRCVLAGAAFLVVTNVAMWQQGIWDLNESPPMKNK